MKPNIIVFIFFILIIGCSVLRAEDDCHIVYGLHNLYKPHEWIDNTGRPTGRNIEILDILAKQAGCTYEVVSYNWNDMITMFQKGQISMMAARKLLEEPDYREYLFYHLPIMDVNYRTFLTRVDTNDINKMEDLYGKTLVVMTGGTTDQFAQKYKEKYNLKVLYYPTIEEGIKALSNGEGDVGIYSTNIVYSFLSSNKYPNLKMTGEPFMASGTTFVISRNNKELYERLNKAMHEIKLNGSYYKVMQKWTYNSTTLELMYDNIKYIAAGVLIFIFAVLLWNKTLRLQVQEKTKAINVANKENEKLREEAYITSRSAALGEMATSIAHEINNPTGLIIHSYRYLSRFIKELVPVVDKNAPAAICSMNWEDAKYEAERAGDVISGSLKRIISSVDELKSYGKTRSNVFDEVDLNNILTSSVNLSGYFIKKYTNDFSITLSEKPAVIYGNPMHIEEVIINLIQNACYALYDKNGRVKCVINIHDNHVKLDVIDNGMGMSDETAKKAMEAFFTTRHESGGTGLGLSISAIIMKEHKGSIEIKSKEGEGSTVSLLFPRII